MHLARHAGAAEARGRILAYTDDDALADADWLVALVRPYADPHVSCVGGRIFPKWEEPPPGWMKFCTGHTPEPLDLDGAFSLLDLGDETVKMKRPRLFGCNLSVRRDRLYELGGFNPEGYGAVWAGDGESGLLRKALAKGQEIVYEPRAIVWHVISPERLAPAYLKQRFANQGVCDEYADYRKNRQSVPELMVRAMRLLCDSMVQRLSAWRCGRGSEYHYHMYVLEAARVSAMARYCLSLAFSRHRRRNASRDSWIEEPDHHVTKERGNNNADDMAVETAP
jgi:hypothetical protein